MAATGGSVAVLLGVPAAVAAPSAAILRTLDQVQKHLLPSEPDAPGAREINAMAYLQFVLGDERLDAEDRELLLTGAAALDNLSRKYERARFVELDTDGRERALRRMVGSPGGEHWVSSMITYLLEALLCAPAYGGNPDRIGWRWVGYQPGFPLPDTDHIYPKLPL